MNKNDLRGALTKLPGPSLTYVLAGVFCCMPPIWEPLPTLQGEMMVLICRFYKQCIIDQSVLLKSTFLMQYKPLHCNISVYQHEQQI